MFSHLCTTTAIVLVTVVAATSQAQEASGEKSQKESVRGVLPYPDAAFVPEFIPKEKEPQPATAIEKTAVEDALPEAEIPLPPGEVVVPAVEPAAEAVVEQTASPVEAVPVEEVTEDTAPEEILQGVNTETAKPEKTAPPEQPQPKGYLPSRNSAFEPTFTPKTVTLPMPAENPSASDETITIKEAAPVVEPPTLTTPEEETAIPSSARDEIDRETGVEKSVLESEEQPITEPIEPVAKPEIEETLNVSAEPAEPIKQTNPASMEPIVEPALSQITEPDIPVVDAPKEAIEDAAEDLAEKSPIKMEQPVVDAPIKQPVTKSKTAEPLARQPVEPPMTEPTIEPTVQPVQQPGPTEKPQPKRLPSKATAIFAGGCFWCMEPPFDATAGVLKTTSGYTGGDARTADYKTVTAGGTGHYEAIEVVYDPRRVSYQELLEIYWANVDALDSKGQFCDQGDSYRPAIFPTSKEQADLALQSKQQVAKKYDMPNIAVEIIPYKEFYDAEDYHQDYYMKHPIRYKYYRWNCGRDARLNSLWGGAERLELFKN